MTYPLTPEENPINSSHQKKGPSSGIAKAISSTALALLTASGCVVKPTAVPTGTAPTSRYSTVDIRGPIVQPLGELPSPDGTFVGTPILTPPPPHPEEIHLPPTPESPFEEAPVFHEEYNDTPPFPTGEYSTPSGPQLTPAPPVEERDIEAIKDTPFGQFFMEYIQDASPSQREHYMESLALFFNHQVNGTYVPTFNKVLLQDGIHMYIDFPSAIPTMTRAEVVEKIEDGLQILRERTNLPVIQIVDTMAEANVHASVMSAHNAQASRYAAETEAFPYAYAYMWPQLDPTQQYALNTPYPTGVFPIEYFIHTSASSFVENYQNNVRTGSQYYPLSSLQTEALGQRIPQAILNGIIKTKITPTTIHEFGHQFGSDHSRRDDRIMSAPARLYLPTVNKDGQLLSPEHSHTPLIPENLDHDGLFPIINAGRAYLLQEGVIEDITAPMHPPAPPIE